MNETKIRNTITECFVGLTKHIMIVDGIAHDEAYRKLMTSELFRLVSDSDTRLYLEPNAELVKPYDLERKNGIDALYQRING